MTAEERLSTVLAAEHAAIFGYGMVGAHLPNALRSEGVAAEQAHRDRRDALLLRLETAGQTPPPAEPTYELPEVTDGASAIQLAIELEERTAAAWRAALSDTVDSDREFALDALIDCATRASHWRQAAGRPATVPFPGKIE